MVFNEKVVYKDKKNVLIDKKEYVELEFFLENDVQSVDESQMLDENIHVEPHTPTSASRIKDT